MGGAIVIDSDKYYPVIVLGATTIWMSGINMSPCFKQILVDDVLDWDWPVLAASLEVDGLPGLLLAEAHVGLGPMVLTLGDGTQQ